MSRRPTCDPSTVRRLRAQDVSEREIARRLGVSRSAVRTALRGEAQETKPRASAKPSKPSTDEKTALRESALRYEAMANDPKVYPRDRIAAGAEARKCWARIAALEPPKDEDEKETREAAESVRARLQRTARERDKRLAEALLGVPDVVAERVCSAVGAKVRPLAVRPVAIDPEDEEEEPADGTHG